MEALNAILKQQGLTFEEIDKEKETIEERYERLRKSGEEICRLENETTGNLQGYECDKCKNRGYFLEMRKQGDGSYSQTRIECECMNIRRMIKKLERSGLKDVVRKYTFANYQTTEEWQKIVKAKAESFVKDTENKWFFFGGQSGCGKSHICTAITISYLRKNIAARYMLWREEVTKIKAVINENEQYREMVDDLKNVPVLYIDDLFKMGSNNGVVQPPTVADINLAYEIINHRYNDPNKTTIISSEYRINEIINIDEALGGRISERTTPYGYCINIKKDKAKNYRLNGVVEL